MAHNPFIPTSAAHTKRYVDSNGEDGHAWNGIFCLLLTTIGNKTGEKRTLPLIYGQYGNAYVVVASKGGHSEDPYWYKNLVIEPAVEIQVGAEKFTATARTAVQGERTKLWKLMTDLFPRYDEYQTMTKREIPVVVIEPNT